MRNRNMRKLLVALILGLCVYGCINQPSKSDRTKRVYYANSDLVYWEETPIDSLKSHEVRYYPNKSLKEKAIYLKKDSLKSVAHGRCIEYYEDGFPKESYIADSGLLLCPRETGIMNGYKVLVDIEKTKNRYVDSTNAFDYHRMRFYVENIPIAHYRMSIIAKDGELFPPTNYFEEVYSIYTLSDDPYCCKDTLKKVKIDETLYPYMLTEYDNKYCLRDSNGVQGYLFGVHFADTTGYIGMVPRQTIFVPFTSDF